MIHRIDLLATPPEPGALETEFVTGQKSLDMAERLARGCVADVGEEGGEALKRCRVEEVWYGEFRNVPARLVEKCYDPRGRTYSNLLAALKAIVNPNFAEGSLVTFVRLKPID